MYNQPQSARQGLTKRQLEVLERLELGIGVKQIARDIGVSRNAVYQTIERLRRQGAVAETYTPSGQPPRRPAETTPALGAAAPRQSSLATLRALAASHADPAAGEYGPAIEGAIASADVVGLAYELCRFDARGESGLQVDLVESALRRLSVLPSVDDSDH